MLEVKKLSEDDAISQIVQTVNEADPGTAPFALVLGSGFSHGLVPTARELVTESVPLWMKSLRRSPSVNGQKEIMADERREIARNFWSGFVNANKNRKLTLPLDPQTGLPESYSDAYRAVFNPGYSGAVGAPAQARRFQRALMRLDKPRLNAAHFLLASLLGVQPGKSRPSELFNSAAAFSRLILTTNFDPFLQTALQAVNRLYFMSDTPELGVGDEIFDDQIDAIHLVYLHGTIHRRSQAATDESIKALKAKNADRLAPVLKRHGVIVLGYSGWDDAIVEALSACEDFDHLLYWCGLEADPLAKGAFGPRVAEILQKPTAFYVQTTGAGRFMAQVVNKLVKGIPRLLDNPISQLRDMLATIDLRELKNLQPVQSAAPNVTTSNTPSSASISDSSANTEVFLEAQNRTLRRLQELEQIFHAAAIPTASDPATLLPGQQPRAGGPPSPIDSGEQVQQLLASARLAAALGNHDETIKLSTDALALVPDGSINLSVLWFERGLAYYSTGNRAEAITDWTRVIELPGAPVDTVAQSLRNRGIAYNEQGDHDKALADYTRLIDELPDAPVAQVAAALRNRGVLFGEKKKTDKELADYSRLIEGLPDPPVEDLSAALRNRGILLEDKGETDKALADYSRLIDELTDPPVEDLAAALINRGRLFDRSGNTDKALADYSRVVDQLPRATAEHLATALGNRAILFRQKGEIEKAVADYNRVISDLPDAQLTQVATALGNRAWFKYTAGDRPGFLVDTEAALKKLPLNYVAFNLGLALLANGRDAEAITAYEQAGKQFPTAIDEFGLNDLREATKTWLSNDRAKPAIDLLESLKK